MPRRTLAFTISEVLIVTLIIGILAAVLFPVVRTSRDRGKHTVTVSNLRSIYQAMLLYAADYQVHDEVENLGNVPAQPLRNSTLLFVYGLSPDDLHSAAFPIQGRKRWGSSFTWFWVTSPDEADPQADAIKNRERLREEGTKFVIVSDIVHDYFEYWPKEQSQDPMMLRRYEINLRVDGSVRSERRPGIRGTVLPFWWQP